MSKDKEIVVVAPAAFEFVEFAKSITPQPSEAEMYGHGTLVRWGDDNLYPDFLLKLFENVPLHQSICTSKVDYLMGDGVLTEDNKPYDFTISLTDPAEDIVRKCCFDHVIFNRFFIGVQYNVFGRPIYVFHIPANEMRTNKGNSRFWVSEDWVRRVNILSYDRFTGYANPQGTTKVYTYSGYVPSVARAYPTIKYKSGITSMVTEILINDFNKDSLEEGFSAAHLISFFKGIPTDANAKLFEDKFKKVYSGTKGMKYIIDWNNADKDAKPLEINEINSPDYSSKLDSVNKKVETNILTAHQATSRILFGVEQNGGIGGNGAELEAAFQTFKEVWVKSNRNIVESGLNKLLVALGFPKFQFKDQSSITKTYLTPQTKERVYTINELRDVDGLPPRADGDVLLQIAPVGLKPGAFAEDAPARKEVKGKKLTEEDFELVKDLGTKKEHFAILDEFAAPVTRENFKAIELFFDDASDIEDWLMKNDITDMSLSDIKAAIRKDLGITITTDDLQIKITNMINAGILTDDKVAPEKPLTRDVQIVYEYDVRPGYGAVLIPGSRGFCKKLIGNDRYYSREDIQAMSAIFGYDVFTHAGGWYYNPNTKEAEDQCRHYFKSVRAIKKADQ